MVGSSVARGVPLLSGHRGRRLPRRAEVADDAHLAVSRVASSEDIRGVLEGNYAVTRPIRHRLGLQCRAVEGSTRSGRSMG